MTNRHYFLKLFIVIALFSIIYIISQIGQQLITPYYQHDLSSMRPLIIGFGCMLLPLGLVFFLLDKTRVQKQEMGTNVNTKPTTLLDSFWIRFLIVIPFLFIFLVFAYTLFIALTWGR